MICATRMFDSVRNLFFAVKMDVEGETGRSKGGVIADVIFCRKAFLSKHVVLRACVHFFCNWLCCFCHMQGNVAQSNRRKQKRDAQRIPRSSADVDEVDEAEVRI